MIEIEKPKLECVESTHNYGKFVVEPLERGFGTTLGNSASSAVEQPARCCGNFHPD